MAKQTKARPRTGESRQVRLPLSIDLLPMDVLEAIKELRSLWGLSWPEIERLSSLPFSEGWREKIGTQGFVNWDALPTRVLDAFPHLRIPHSNLHRWYDLRVEQAYQDVITRTEQARIIATAFAKTGIKNDDEAVTNAARDLVFELLQAPDTKSRLVAVKALLALKDVMNGARANDIKERKVAVDERKIVQLEKDAELKRKRVEQETESAAKKINKGGELTIEDINRLRERTFGLPPIKRG
jgi:autonomous glycyl radical cofactor GrcA